MQDEILRPAGGTLVCAGTAMRYANDTLTGTLLPDCASVSLLHSVRTLLSTPRALLAARSRVRLRVIPSLCVESTLLVARLRISPRSAGSDFALH